MIENSVSLVLKLSTGENKLKDLEISLTEIDHSSFCALHFLLWSSCDVFVLIFFVFIVATKS